MGERFSISTPRKAVSKETPMPCPEPGCGGKLRRRWSSRFERYWYACDQWKTTGCKGSVGCHPDGRPLGIPADSETRRKRTETHEVFDRVWKEGLVQRGDAYRHFGHLMGVDPLHIGELDSDQCERLQDLVYEFLAEAEVYGGFG